MRSSVSMFLRTIIPVLFLLNAAACSGGGGDSGSSSPGTERIFLLDDQGFHEFTGANGADRSTIAPQPKGGVILDAAISREGDQVALSIQSQPKQEGSGGYDFGVDLFAGRLSEEPRQIAVHQSIGESIMQPNWLPGGREIIAGVLSRAPSGAIDGRIERIDVTTGVRTRLIDDASEPSLSPDGRTLAFVAFGPATGEQLITIMDLSTGATRPLLPRTQIMNNVANIAWAPDGSRLAFAASDPLSLAQPPAGAPPAALHPSLRDVWLVGIDGSGLKRRTELADGTLALAWSLDGANVYALGDTGFWRIPAGAGDPVKVGRPVLIGRIQVLAPK
jgi:hypothetical protein